MDLDQDNKIARLQERFDLLDGECDRLGAELQADPSPERRAAWAGTYESLMAAARDLVIAQAAHGF